MHQTTECCYCGLILILIIAENLTLKTVLEHYIRNISTTVIYNFFFCYWIYWTYYWICSPLVYWPLIYVGLFYVGFRLIITRSKASKICFVVVKTKQNLSKMELCLVSIYIYHKIINTHPQATLDTCKFSLRYFFP